MITSRRWAGVLMTFLWMAFLAGCGSSSSSPPPSNGGPGSLPEGLNVVPVSIGVTTLCNRVNQPCLSVTICIPGSSQCQTVSDILLDTGSIGLRVFKSVLTLDFSSHIEKDAQGNQIGECVTFGTGADWGPVAMAGIILGQEPQIVVPIQLIDAKFAGQSATNNLCGQVVDDTPDNARLNGILGIDVLGSDTFGDYHSCPSQGCSQQPGQPGIQPPDFVQNPIAALPNDNNGYVVSFPAVGDNGAPTLTGSLILGVGTQPNNTPPGVSVLTLDSSFPFMATSYKGTTYVGFLDTGSTFLFFQDTIPTCLTIDGAFCPPSPLRLSATNRGINQVSTAVNFQVANAENLRATGNGIFNNIAGPITVIQSPNTDQLFDWGLPFFLGRTVYTGIAGRDSVLGTGPYWAY